MQVSQLHQNYQFYIHDTTRGRNETFLRIRVNPRHYPLSARSKAHEGIGYHRPMWGYKSSLPSILIQGILGDLLRYVFTPSEDLPVSKKPK